MNWKIAAPIAVVVIAVAAVMSMDGKEAEHLAVNNAELTRETAAETQAGQDTAPALAMKVAPALAVSGNIDDLMASLASESDGDLTLIDGSAEDAALVTADNQSVNDFTTAYDEKTF